MDTTEAAAVEIRSRVYEQLDYAPEPQGYSSNIPWIVQQQIAATNGVHYIDRIGKLKDYPVFELPSPAVQGNKLMLDIGCGWGRWLVGGANKGYIPVGIDIRLEFAQTARQVLKDQGKTGYTVVADLENLPFKDNVFDLIWSFSVIQHTHYKRLTNCLRHIDRMLVDTGFTMLEFPSKTGLRNKRSPNMKESEAVKDDYNSWFARYYTPEEYKEIFDQYLAGFSYTTHSFFGIGILKEDLKYVSVKNKLLCLTSLIATGIANVISPLSYYADSLYIKAKKKSAGGGDSRSSVEKFLALHAADPNNNLNIIELLRCPKTGSSLELSADKTKAISKGNGIYYPVENGVPVMIATEARSL
jgi:ubiquinone/menaquinone biosynthesis C-methylase UbiE/uncharacterized protein YbaR (Trm112 family)